MERSPLLPEVPTFAEEGFNVSIRDEINVLAPAGTPGEILEAIDAAVLEAFGDEGFLEALSNRRLVANYGDRAELTTLIGERTAAAEAFLADF